MKKKESEKSLEELFTKVDENIIGVWKFRQVGKKPLWCATYAFKGNYYDTFGKASLPKTLEQVSRELKKLNTKVKEKKSHKKK